MTIESVKQAVGAAIQRASEATGVDFGFLMRTAGRESGFNPAARAAGSSAAGLYQFVEQTWLGALKRHGAKYGYGDYADLIQGAGEGRLSVQGGGAARRAVMALRLDARAASLMAGELASENFAYLKGRTGREPTAGELYIAHFLGAKGSAELIEASRSRPGASAAALFPEAASANPAIFYHGGRAASVAEVYANLTSGQSAEPADAASAALGAAAQPGLVHRDVQGRLARLEAERALTAMILGTDGEDGFGSAFGGSSAGRSGGGTQGLAGSMFTAEMLTLLSEARDKGAKA